MYLICKAHICCILIALIPMSISHSGERIKSNECEKSSTTVNGVRVMCKDELIFEDNFEQIVGDRFADEDHYRYLNSTIWKREVVIPQDPDYEFCVYHKVEKSLRVDDSVLKIIPSFLDDTYGENISYFGRLQLPDCQTFVPGACYRKAVGYNILPPIISTRLITKHSFTFRYGKIEIRAKFPEGDWLYPEMWLQPKYSLGGTGYLGGRVILGMARGNINLAKKNGTRKDFSSRQLEFGLRTGTNENVTDEIVRKEKESGTWTEDFHVYTTIWSKNGFVFKVDDEVVGQVRQQSRSATEKINMAPYDLEFYLSLGVGVGGMRVFPDGVKSGYYDKPWKNVAVKAMLRFWQAKDKWISSWQIGNKYQTSLKIDYVRVWSIGE